MLQADQRHRTRIGHRMGQATAMLAAFLIAACLARPAHAALQIEITSGVRDPVPIAVVPFAPAPPADGGLDVAQVVQHDLEGSGRFRALPRERMPGAPDACRRRRRRGLEEPSGSDYVVVGRVVDARRRAGWRSISTW